MKKSIYMKSGNHRILRCYFKSYFIILIIPLIISSLYYLKSIKVIKENAVLENETVLKQISQTLEKQLDIMYECCDVTASNYYVRLFGFSNQTDKAAKPFDILNLQRNVPNYPGISELISNFYIFFNNSEMVINNSMAYSFSDMYNLSWHREGEGWEEWRKGQRSDSGSYYQLQPCQNWVNGYTNEKAEKLSFLYPLPSYSGKGGSVLLLIDKEALANIVAPGNIEDGVWYIQNSSGEILIHSSQPCFSVEDISRAIEEKYPATSNLHGSTLVYENEKMIVTRICNEGEQYKYTMVYPRAAVLQQADFMFFLLIGTLAVSFIFGIVACVLASAQNSMPIGHILETLAVVEPDGKADIFGMIQKAISDISRKNDVMSQALLGQLPYLKEAFLTRLLSGDFESEKEAWAMADYTHFQRGCSYFVMAIRFEDIKDDRIGNLQVTDAYKLAVFKVLEDTFGNLLYTDTGELYMAVLLSLNDELKKSENYLENYIRYFVGMLQKKLPTYVFDILTFYVGTEVDSLLKVVHSYESVSSLLFQEPERKNYPVILYREQKDDNSTYYHPGELDNKLINTTLMGKEKTLHNYLEELIRINLIERKLPHYVQEIFISDLQSCFIRTVEQSGITDEKKQHFLNELENCRCNTLLKQMQIVTEMYTQLCSYIAEEKTKKSSSMVNDVVAYVNLNYINPELSLSFVADAMHMNPTYLSERFKQSYGKNFSSYVEEVRMEKAKGFVIENKMSTMEIASAVGFISTNSFCRAFKRYTGLSTMQYREKLRNEKC